MHERMKSIYRIRKAIGIELLSRNQKLYIAPVVSFAAINFLLGFKHQFSEFEISELVSNRDVCKKRTSETAKQRTFTKVRFLQWLVKSELAEFAFYSG